MTRGEERAREAAEHGRRGRCDDVNRGRQTPTDRKENIGKVKKRGNKTENQQKEGKM